MLTAEKNKLITDTMPGTPCGDMFRRYWQPIILSRELEGNRPVGVTILGEYLVVFRDEEGKVGVLDAQCCHRKADLTYGRLEDGGIRCLYHGWLYNVDGKCLDTPGEPQGSTLKDQVCQKAYPCKEAAGAVFAYLGTGETPLFPNYEMMLAPTDQIYNMKAFLNCNYLQSMEGNTDPTHTGFLHRPLQKLLDDQQRKLAAMGNKAPSVQGVDNQKDVFELFANTNFRQVKLDETAFGTRIYCERELSGERVYFRALSWAVPNISAVVATEHRAAPGGGCMMLWNVPIDNETHLRFEFYYQRKLPVEPKFYEDFLVPHVTEDFRHKRTASNRYGQDPQAMQDENFTGMGTFFPVHDAAVTESMGAICDRSDEHLGTADAGIMMNRRLIFKAIEDVQNGKDPQNVIRDAKDNDYTELVALNAVVEDTGQSPQDMFKEQMVDIEKYLKEEGRLPCK
jgi:phthalate 4,5-dioxygenase oxygenase subunit